MATVRIPLTQGKYALIDEEDAPLVGALRWHVTGIRDGYPYAMNRRTRTLMHRLIMGANSDQIVDHINGDGLDNRRANLRFATKSTNAANSVGRSHGAARFKGVHFYKRDGRWTAQITKDGKRRHLGYFNSEEDAARAYDQTAGELFGEFALPNLPDRINEPPPQPRAYPLDQRKPPSQKGKRRKPNGRT